MKYQIILEEYYTPANGGRSYQSERVIGSYEDPFFAKEVVDQLNSVHADPYCNAEAKYYSIRKVEE
jgi:hypothetical protein